MCGTGHVAGNELASKVERGEESNWMYLERCRRCDE